MHYLTLNAAEVIGQYPKSIEQLKAWVKTKATATTEDIDLAEYRQQLDTVINDEYISAVLQYNPRQLYDFFDHMDLVIAIVPREGRFYNSIVGDDQEAGLSSARWAAEITAFTRAFFLLENQL